MKHGRWIKYGEDGTRRTEDVKRLVTGMPGGRHAVFMSAVKPWF